MSPAFESYSGSFTYSQPVSQIPNPIFSSNPFHQPQSSSSSVGGEECNWGLNFDCSKMGADLVGQPRVRRLRYPLKKLRRKLGSGNARCADSLSSESLDQPNEYGIGATTRTSDTSNNLCGGSVKAKEDNGIFGNAGWTSGANRNSFESYSSSENRGFGFGTSRSGSTSNLSFDFSFVFGADNSSAELNSNIQSRAQKSGLQSNSTPKIENVVFDAEENSSSPKLSYENAGFVFGANKSGSNVKSSLSEMNGSLGISAGDSLKEPGFGDGNLSFNAGTNNTTSSTNLAKMIPDRAMGLSGEEKMQNFNNVSFVFGATEAELASASKLEQKGSNNRSAFQSEVDESSKFVHVGFVSSENRTSVAAENRTSEKELHSDCIWKTIPDMRGKVKLDAREVSEQDGHSSTMFGTCIDNRVRKDNLPFVFGAKGNGLESTAELQKSKTSAGSTDYVAKGKGNAEMTNEFRKADLNGVFVFGCGGKEKLDPNGRNECIYSKNHLKDEKTKDNSDFTMLLNDAMRSNFKFVFGNSSTPASAFYKIPLSKLFDEIKSLNIDDSKGISGADKVKEVRSNSCFCSDQVDAAQNNGQMPGFSTEKPGATLQDQHKDAKVGGAMKCSDPKEDDLKCSDPREDDLKCSNRRTSESDYNLETGNSFRGSIKITKFVGINDTESRSSGEISHEEVDSSFVSAGVFGKENQPSISDGTTGHFWQNGSSFEAPSTKFENKENLSFTSTTVEPKIYSKGFNTANLNEPSSIVNPFSELNKKFEFFADRSFVKEKKLKKTRRKLRQRIRSKSMTGHDHLYKEGISPKNFESPGGCSPMDFSPYQHCKDETPASLARETKEGDGTSGSQRFDVHENDRKFGEPDNLDSKGLDESNLNLATSSSAQDGLSSIRRQYRKKYKLKVGDGLNGKIAAREDGFSSSSVQFSPYKERVQSQVAPIYHSKTDREHTKQDASEATTHEFCEHWRVRGNQAYKSRDLSKAEEFYTKGINAAAGTYVSGIGSKPLILCYSNRAATRMSLGRMREALDDCKAAAALDPCFSKVKIRAANCHLVLGEVQEAMEYYNDCLESGNKVCLDRRFTIEAADGLQKAQKVADCISKFAELMQQRTSDAAKRALDIITDALTLSCYSEKLLAMKGEALFQLKRYNEVLELCEQTRHVAEKNVTANYLENLDDAEAKNSVRLWRWRLMSKSHFHLGRLEAALDLIEKRELEPISNRCGVGNPEIPIPLAVTIRGLLGLKKAGNEAFQLGKHVEAIEHYTAAISSSAESRPFAAICFCNRAAAHQALGQIIDAIADCSLAIALDGNYPKAVSRRATLHEMIRDYKQAIDDLQRLIALLENQMQEKTQQSGKQDGSSGSNKKELKHARHRLALMEDMAKKGTSLDLYLILGTKTSDTESDIKKAYRKAALRHHPDKVGQFLAKKDGGDDGRLWKDIVEKVHEDADRLFKMIGEAYAVLSDPDKRSKYDCKDEIRDVCRDNNRNTNSRRPSDFYSSPYNGGHWSSRESDFYSSPSGRSRNRRNWQDSWSSHDNPHSRW